MKETSLANQVASSKIPDAWIDKLFSRFSAMYGRKFADLWSDCNLKDVKALWAEELSAFSREELAFGVNSCKTRIFPPMLPEFLLLCRPPLDYERIYVEASKSIDSGNWSSKLAFWAAKSVGQFEVRNEPYKRMESRWKKAVDELLMDGELPEILVRQEALPPPGQTSIGKEEAKKRVMEIGLNPKKKDQKAWARQILEAPASYPAISVKFANKAIEFAA